MSLGLLGDVKPLDEGEPLGPAAARLGDTSPLFLRRIPPVLEGSIMRLCGQKGYTSSRVGYDVAAGWGFT